MAILNIQQGQAGLSGTNPSWVYIDTNDTLATVTASGYLNGALREGVSLSNKQMALVTTVASVGAAPQSVMLSVSIAAGVASLVAPEVSIPAPLIVPGNIQAGQSGTAGALLSYPSTASKGFLELAAVANSGNTGTIISNVAMGQASTVSIPDPGNAAGRFLVGATANPFVNGNFPQNSGTGGLMVDSGVSVASVSSAVTQLGNLFQAKVTFNTAQMVTAYDTPLQIVANPAASQMILVLQASVYTASTGNTPYATGTAPIIQYSTGGTNGAHGTGTIATAAGLVATDITAATSQVRNLFGIATGVQTGLSGKGLYFSNATGDYTAGTGTSITITVVYQLLVATV